MPNTPGLRMIRQDDDNIGEGWQISPSQSKSSASSIFANPDEDWRTSTDFEERRRIQSRIAQRQYRQRQKQRKAQKCPEKEKQGTRSGPEATETTEEDLSALEVPFSDFQQQMAYPLHDQHMPEASHQQFLPSRNEYLVPPHQPFVTQLPSPQPSLVTTWPMDTGSQSQPIDNLDSLSFPAIPQSEPSQLLGGYAIPSQQPTVRVPYSSSLCAWNCRTTPDHQPACNFQSPHPRLFRPQSHHCQQHNHEHVTCSHQNVHHDSTSPSPCGCSSSAPYFSYHSSYPPHQTSQTFIQGYHEIEKTWADRKSYIQNPYAHFGCCHHHKGPMDDSHTSAWPQPYAHASLIKRQTCCCSQDEIHSSPADIRYLL